jgi:hypothetical protein
VSSLPQQAHSLYVTELDPTGRSELQRPMVDKPI